MRPTRGLFDRFTGGTAAGGPAPAAPAATSSAASAGRPIVPPDHSRTLRAGDPALRLPEGRARSKFIALRTAAEDARLILQGLAEQQRQAAERKLNREGYLARLQDSRGGGSGGGGRATSSVSTWIGGGHMNPAGAIEHYQPSQVATGGQVAEAAREVAEDAAALAAINERIAAQQAKIGGLLPALTRWLASLPLDTRIELFRPAGAARKAAKGGATVADVEAQRRLILEKRAELEQTKARPYPAAEVKAMLRRQVAGIASRGEPDILGSIERLSPARFPEIHKTNPVITPSGAGIVSDSSMDIVGLFFLIHGKDILAWLDAKVDALSEDHIALSSEERQSRERQILAEILQAERDEEALIEQLEMSGAPVARRDNVDPRAVLGLSGDLPGEVPMF